MKDVTDELIATLRGAHGDLPKPGKSRWGKVARLASGSQVDQTKRLNRLTFVQTEIISNTPIPIAIKLRFSLDGQTYTPEYPSTAGGRVIVDLIETIDMKSGAFRESFTLDPGEAMPVCSVIACALNLSVTLDAEDAAIFVEAVAAPTTMIDCRDVVPTPPPLGKPAGFNTTTDEFPAAILDAVAVPANANRAYLLVVNHSAVDFTLFLNGSSNAAIVLPGGAEAGYDVDNFRGPLTGEFAGDDASGFVSITQGTYV